MIGYNADSAELHGSISHWPYTSGNSPDATREVYSWDLGRKLGEIPEASKTYNVMGNANCQGLVIGETTLGGLSELSNVGKDWRNGTILDYGSLIWVTLQRAATAREAITVMDELVNRYGYASDMEGFSISDATTNEVWYMEFIGKGSFGKGAVWVALRVPEGYVMAHANQARITTFLPCDDESKCRMAPDTVTFAIERGYWKGARDDPAFSFSDVYDPVTFSGARFCEARVWSVFCAIADAATFDCNSYLSYASGHNLTNRMPLFVKPRSPLSREQVHGLLSLHFDGTWLSPYHDVGAGAEHSPYRWNGLTWEYEGKTYVNERIVGTQYTAWHYVASLRADVPKPMGALQWWGADDHTWAPKIPIHGGASLVHASYDDANCTARSACRRAHQLPGTVTDFSLDSAWWLNNLVADQVYSKVDRAAPIVRQARAALDQQLLSALDAAEATAKDAFGRGATDEGLSALSKHAVLAGATATKAWRALWQELLVKLIDGRVTRPVPSNPLCECSKEKPHPRPRPHAHARTATLTQVPSNPVCECSKESASFSDAWKAKVISDTKDHYLKPDSSEQTTSARLHSKRARSKLSIPGVA